MPTDEHVGTALLSEKEHKQLQRAHPEIGTAELALVVSASSKMLKVIAAILERLQWEEAQSKQVLDLLTQEISSRVLSQAQWGQLRLQAKSREHFLETYPTLSSAEVAELSGSSAQNKAALANRWKQEGRVFAVPVDNADRYPSFQLGEDGKPRSIIKEILPLFEGESGWTIALWFAAPSGWLGDEPPAKYLEIDPQAVLEAARRSSEPLEV